MPATRILLISRADSSRGRLRAFPQRPERTKSMAATRRIFAVAAIALSLGMSGPASAQYSRVVNVYNWSDYIDPQVLENFTTETGIKVQYDTFDANETLETKLLAGKSGYDVVVPTGYFLERQIKEIGRASCRER